MSFQPLTPHEIENRLRERMEDNDLVEAIHIAYTNYRNLSLAEMRSYLHQGRISENVWEAYCYLWRNTAVRLSSEMEEYEL